MTRSPFPREKYLDQVATAVASNRIGQSTADNIGKWLSGDHYQSYWPQIADHVRNEKWATLEEVFWTEIPFGTAGRRGRMYPIGCNAINDRTIGETIQALAEYVRETYDGPKPMSCAIAYDTRHHSLEFARLCAEIMVAHEFEVLFFEGFRSTPLLATTVRYKNCACGIMVSASHNPPSDNAAKVFWSTGGQLRSPHDSNVTERMAAVTTIQRRPFDESVVAEKIHYVGEEMDAVYLQTVLDEGFGMGRGPRGLKVLYSPLHGVGLTSVVPVLHGDGFTDVEVYDRHAEPNGCFPNVPDHVANPENPAVFDELIERAKATGADVILASDPDADRLGCATALELGGSKWQPLTGNQIAVLLTEYVLRHRSQGGLSPDHFIVKTLVTSDMMCRVAEGYGIRAIGECLTGFKWIGSLVDEHGPDKFILGAEEAHGYLIGTHARDKDGAVAAMLLAEFAAEAKADGRSLHEELDLLLVKHGCHLERTIAKKMPGADGMAKMQSIMQSLRDNPPQEIGGIKVTEVRDYLSSEKIDFASGAKEKMEDSPTGNLLIFETELPGNRVAVRPSGTEPKIKFYLFAQEAVKTVKELEAMKQSLISRLDQMQETLLADSP